MLKDHRTPKGLAGDPRQPVKRNGRDDREDLAQGRAQGRRRLLADLHEPEALELHVCRGRQTIRGRDQRARRYAALICHGNLTLPGAQAIRRFAPSS